ncbi:uncharacterized protein LOC116351174 [Contarinia nasturtii]|uniref:uncharacterized protein LOC116351174 n=1 Tax=Contarinia nasturtii TaxID=265458 RepID=UPI0012D3C5D7|nr:uncharacterized protein LOC116351174 [Contarinia nasturtii]
MSSGMHPFGDAVKRQLNIISYECDLKLFSNPDMLDSTGVLAEELIGDMISREPVRRPTAKAILSHPFFWNAEKILNFLQDVSDRVEKIDFQSDPLKTLEKNSKFITREDWNLHLDETITSDLRKYRAYQGNSVRDLLRALRNKKHHYHELSIETQMRLGPIPQSFMKYWIDRFPRLLSHSYHALESCSNEPIFSCYYPSTCYVFSKPRYFYEETEDFKPFDTGSKSRDSPNRFNYKPMNYPNFVMTRKTGPKFQNNYGPMNNGDGTNLSTYTRATKKGAYNFHRFANNEQNNYKPEHNENLKWADNAKAYEFIEVTRNEQTFEKCDNEERGEQYDNGAKEKRVLNVRNVDFDKIDATKADDSEKKGDNFEKKAKNTDNPKFDKSKKKNKIDAAVSKEPEPLEDDGFTKVRYRGHGNSKKQKNNEQVTWIIPNQEKK